MKTTGWRVALQDSIFKPAVWLLPAITLMFAGRSAFADGCFVFRWDKQKDINEPTQKAIILHAQGREDLVLQVKYEGPAEDFGWVVPVPNQPEVSKGSMEPFYELSRLTQRHFREGMHGMRLRSASKGGNDEAEVKVIEVKTVGAYEVAVLSSSNPSALADWLAAHQFNFPKEKQNVLDQYIQRHWFFVAARVNPEGNGFAVKTALTKHDRIPAPTRKKLASGELHPIIISFPSDKCVFPLAISSVNGTPSELSLYVLSAEPLLSPVILEKKFKAYKAEKDKWLSSRPERMAQIRNRRENLRADILRNSPLGARMQSEDPNDPPPDSVFEQLPLGRPPEMFDEYDEDFYGSELQLVRSMSVQGDAEGLKGCRNDLPRFRTKQWWLTKLVETFSPEEMVDIEFEPALPVLTERMSRPDGEAAARCLPQYGSLAVPTVVHALNNSDASVRKHGLVAAMEIRNDTRLVEPLLKLLDDAAPDIRRNACNGVAANWDSRFAEPLIRLLGDTNPAVASTAQYVIRQHVADVKLENASLRQMLAADGPVSLFALQTLQVRRGISHEELVHLLSYTNLQTLSSAFSSIRDQVTADELAPLMTNSLPIGRMMALGALARMGDKAAVERIVSMLHDPNEAIRWRVRSSLRRLTGQKLGADPAAYDKWWAENKDTYAPNPERLRAGRI